MLASLQDPSTPVGLPCIKLLAHNTQRPHYSMVGALQCLRSRTTVEVAPVTDTLRTIASPVRTHAPAAHTWSSATHDEAAPVVPGPPH